MEAGFIHLEAEYRRKDGSLYPVEVCLRAVQLDQPYVLAVGRDITERKRAVAALQTTNEQLTNALREQAPILQGLALFRTLLDQSNDARSEEHTSELQSLRHLVCRLLLE